MGQTVYAVRPEGSKGHAPVKCGGCGHVDMQPLDSWGYFEDVAEHEDGMTTVTVPFEVEFHRCPECGRVDAWAGGSRGWVTVFEGRGAA